MSIQKININGVDVEIEDVSARTNISNLTSEVNTVKGDVTTNTNNITSINTTIGSETLQTTSKTLKGAINEVKQSIGASGGGGGGLPCIDTTNLIYEQSFARNVPVEYKATEDCIMCLSLDIWGSGTYINVNNTRVFDADCYQDNYGASSFMTLNLKRGDEFFYYPTVNSSNGIRFRVFGIRY